MIPTRVQFKDNDNLIDKLDEMPHSPFASNSIVSQLIMLR